MPRHDVIARLTRLFPAVLLVTAAFGAAPRRVALTAETVLNTADGSIWNECPTQEEIAAGTKHQMWLTYGKVRQEEKGWQASPAATRCGDGFYTEGGPGSPSGTPYLIVEVERTPAVRESRVDLQTTLKVRRFSSFDDKGRPVYTRDEQTRRFDLGPTEDAYVPLLAGLPREADSLHLREMMLHLQARVLGQEAATYGAIAVTADMPGTDIFLDGGPAGRTLEPGPAVLSNIRTGNHEVRLRDVSGRTAVKPVAVEKDRTAEVRFDLLSLPPAEGRPPLVPIGKNTQGGEELWRSRDGAVVVRVPGGEFVMGAADGEGETSEHPQHKVFVSEFLMDRTEVTWRQFRKFSQATGTPMPPTPLWGTPDDYPACSVLYDEAAAYCSWVGGRLPTEAEWEKGSRGTDGRRYPWGNDWEARRCNCIEGGTHRPEGVAAFPNCLSPYGMVDMAGGVWEWCSDWWSDTYSADAAKDPQGPSTGQERVLRGGSWLNMPTWLRTTFRQKGSPTWRNVHHGFRCVEAASPETAADGK